MSPPTSRGARKPEPPENDNQPAATPAPRSLHRAEVTTDEFLRIARDYRKAARLIAGDETLTVRARCSALLELNRKARREVLPEFAAAAVWGGARHLFEADRGVPRDVVEANRRLLRRGHDACPTCRRPLPSHDQLDRWLELGRRSILERRGAA